MKIIAMIPARLGSQRLKKKNLKELDGIPLITRAIRKCKESGCFTEIWVNSENDIFAEIANSEGVSFYKRPEILGGNDATSEEFVLDFLLNNECDYLIQVHSIAPLLTAKEIKEFTTSYINSEDDVMLSCVNDQIECVYQGIPINFTYDAKENSQNLLPIQRITWSITGWKREIFLKAKRNGKCATYYGSVGYFPVSAIAGHVIKTQQDLDIASALLTVLERKTNKN